MLHIAVVQSEYTLTTWCRKCLILYKISTEKLKIQCRLGVYEMHNFYCYWAQNCLGVFILTNNSQFFFISNTTSQHIYLNSCFFWEVEIFSGVLDSLLGVGNNVWGLNPLVNPLLSYGLSKLGFFLYSQYFNHVS